MERYEEIENSLLNEYKESIYAKFVEAIHRYELIKKGDKVCVCISGGKDSMLMAKCFQLLKRNDDIGFDVKYLVMNPGYNDYNLQVILNNLKTLNVTAEIVETNIFDIANVQIKSPCYLCAKMRRGALYKFAGNLGCNKIALGHHFDDVIETTLMNMLNAGSFQTMLPKLHSENYEGMELIRPLYLVREKDVKAWRDTNQLMFIQCACRFTENTANEENGGASQRLRTKYLISELCAKNPEIEMNIFNSASNVNMDKNLGYKIRKECHSFLEDYDK